MAKTGRRAKAGSTHRGKTGSTQATMAGTGAGNKSGKPGRSVPPGTTFSKAGKMVSGNC